MKTGAGAFGLRRQPPEGEASVARSKTSLEGFGNGKELTLDPYDPRRFGQVGKARCKNRAS